jgi:hypothetical protein
LTLDFSEQVGVAALRSGPEQKQRLVPVRPDPRIQKWYEASKVDLDLDSGIGIAVRGNDSERANGVVADPFVSVESRKLELTRNHLFVVCVAQYMGGDRAVLGIR